MSAFERGHADAIAGRPYRPPTSALAAGQYAEGWASARQAA